MFVGWTTRSKFYLVSSVIDSKTQCLIDGVDLLEIVPVNACETAFKLDEATCMWKTCKIRLCCTRKVFEACGKKKKPAFKSKETAERMRSDIRESGCPVYTCPKNTGSRCAREQQCVQILRSRCCARFLKKLLSGREDLAPNLWRDSFSLTPRFFSFGSRR